MVYYENIVFKNRYFAVYPGLNYDVLEMENDNSQGNMTLKVGTLVYSLDNYSHVCNT